MHDMDLAKVQFILDPVHILQLQHLSCTNKCQAFSTSTETAEVSRIPAVNAPPPLLGQVAPMPPFYFPFPVYPRA